MTNDVTEKSTRIEKKSYVNTNKLTKKWLSTYTKKTCRDRNLNKQNKLRMKKVENFRPERECRMSPGAKIYNGLGLADQA